MSLLAIQVLNGLQLGLLMFLVAAGLTLVFGVMDFINLAHGVQYMMGAYLAATFIGWSGHFVIGLGMALIGIMVFGLSLILFSFSSSLVSALIFLFFAGAANVFYNSTNNGLIQSLVEDNYRGRVLSMLQLNRGLVPLGTAVTGFFAEKFGAPAALAGMSSMLIVLGGIALIVRPKTRISAEGEEVPLHKAH